MATMRQLFATAAVSGRWRWVPAPAGVEPGYPLTDRIAVAVSWAVLAATLCGWVDCSRSYLHQFEWVAAGGGSVSFTSHPGMAAVTLDLYWGDWPERRESREPGVDWRREWVSGSMRESLGYGRETRMLPGVRLTPLEPHAADAGIDESGTVAGAAPAMGVLLDLPYWLLALAASVLPARYVHSKWEAWRQQRLEETA
jgi:hypothetical protein